MQKALLRVFFSLMILFSGQFLTAQDMSSQNLQSVNVDDLSDAQIQGYLKKAEASGYSEQQLEAMAKARGMSATQIAKLRSRIAQLKSGSTSSSNSSNVPRSRGRNVNQGNQTQTSNSESDVSDDPFAMIFESDSLDISDGLPIFGMSFFQNQNLTFEPSLNIATPKGYQVGPGDQIIIDVWGASEQTYQLEVSPEGSVFVPSVGPIYLNGLSMERAESRIKTKLKSIYSTLGDNTFAQVSLGQIRTISVNVIGEVVKPGTYQMSSFGTAFNALYLAGGPNESGSLREIQIFRGGKKEATLDAYNFLVFGEGQNIMLQDQDVVLVKPYLNRVSIEGEVKRPAYYEMRDAETFSDLLSFCGGFTANAFKESVSFQRNLSNRKTVQTANKNAFDQMVMMSGDKVMVDEIRDLFVGRVTVDGAVNHPGEYQLTEGLMLSDLISQADGFSPDVFMSRAVVIRQNPNFTLSTLAFSPEQLMNDQYDLELQSEDVIKVNSIFDMREDWMVSIQGEVQSPGDFDYSEHMTVEDLIFLADGFKETAAKSFVEVARRGIDKGQSVELFSFSVSEDLRLDENDADFELKPFDIIVIRKSPYYQEQEVVEVEGEVLYPGRYVLNNAGERISDIIERAGGFTDEAFPAGGSLIRKTEYYDEGKAALVKRLRIQALGNYDSTSIQGTFAINRAESIALQFEKILKSPGGAEDLILKDGDVISIPKELQTVRVRGEVHSPSNIVYSNGLTLKDFVAMSGGDTENAKMSRAYVVYANGSAGRTRSFFGFKDFPKVEPGAEIIIPRKPDKQKLSPQALISLTSGIATLSLVIIRIVDSIPKK